MESLYFLVPCALVFIALAIKALFWAINNGQYDNLDTEAHRILFDAEAKKPNVEAKPGLAPGDGTTQDDLHPPEPQEKQ